MVGTMFAVPVLADSLDEAKERDAHDPVQHVNDADRKEEILWQEHEAEQQRDERRRVRRRREACASKTSAMRDRARC